MMLKSLATKTANGSLWYLQRGVPKSMLFSSKRTLNAFRGDLNYATGSPEANRKLLDDTDTLISSWGYKNSLGEFLFRISEQEDLDRVIEYGTDRGGFPPPRKMWSGNATRGSLYPGSAEPLLHEDVMYGTTEEEILRGEKNAEFSTSFKKIDGIENPMLLLYAQECLTKTHLEKQWEFKDKGNKLDALFAVITITKDKPSS